MFRKLNHWIDRSRDPKLTYTIMPEGRSLVRDGILANDDGAWTHARDTFLGLQAEHRPVFDKNSGFLIGTVADLAGKSELAIKTMMHNSKRNS
jgi:hypothetical protein